MIYLAKENTVNRPLLALLFFTLLLTGCGIKHPQSAIEFRKAVPTAFMGEKSTFVANRPFSKVAATFKKQAKKCLDVRVKTVSQTSMSYQVLVTKYNPTLIVGKSKLELHVQQLHEKGVMNISKVPDGGYYYLVADAYSTNKSKTRVDIYGASMGNEAMKAAIKGWATGKNIGCPDLAK